MSPRPSGRRDFENAVEQLRQDFAVFLGSHDRRGIHSARPHGNVGER